MAPPLNIVVVEDHDLLREATVAALSSAGHRAIGVIAAEDLEDSPETLGADIYVIDLNLPGEDGINLSKRLRAAQPAVGIIMATARIEIGQRMQGYESGADIYLSKPVSPEELLAAVHALGRRLGISGENGKVTHLDTQAMSLSYGGAHVKLTYGETRLLAAFARAPEYTLERYQVAELLGIKLDRSQESSSLEVRLSNLRKKLDQAGVPGSIRSIRGVGYRIGCPIRVV